MSARLRGVAQQTEQIVAAGQTPAEQLLASLPPGERVERVGWSSESAEGAQA